MHMVKVVTRNNWSILSSHNGSLGKLDPDNSNIIQTIQDKNNYPKWYFNKVLLYVRLNCREEKKIIIDIFHTVQSAMLKI